MYKGQRKTPSDEFQFQLFWNKIVGGCNETKMRHVTKGTACKERKHTTGIHPSVHTLVAVDDGGTSGMQQRTTDTEQVQERHWLWELGAIGHKPGIIYE